MARTSKSTKSTKSTKKTTTKVEKVNKDTQVMNITKENWGPTKQRAKAIQARLAKYYQKNGTFPSHQFVISNWGYAICPKAVLRHKRQVCETLNIKMPETSKKDQVKRKAKVK